MSGEIKFTMANCGKLTDIYAHFDRPTLSFDIIDRDLPYTMQISNICKEEEQEVVYTFFYKNKIR